MAETVSARQVSQALKDFYSRPVAKVSLELILTILLVVFLAFFAIRPTLTTMSDLVKEIEDKRELSQQMTRKIAALSTAQIEYASIANRLEVLQEAIPDTPQLVSTLKIIEKLANENSVVVSSVTVNEVPPEKTDTQELPKTATRQNLAASFTVTADYISIRNFVESLMRVRRSIVVDTISFSVDDNRVQKTLKATITINLPYYGVKAADEE